MNSGADIGAGEEKVKVMFVEVLQHLNAIDKLLLLSQPCKALLTAREGTIVKFSRFDGIGDPLRWIHHCERYFRIRRTPENKRVAYAAFHLRDDTQLWY
jgi:hypothetical protein